MNINNYVETYAVPVTLNYICLTVTHVIVNTCASSARLVSIKIVY